MSPFAATAFLPSHTKLGLPVPALVDTKLMSSPFDPEDDDLDGIGRVGADNQYGGKELATDFYKELQKRQETTSSGYNDKDKNNTIRSEKTTDDENIASPAKEESSSSLQTQDPLSKKKFTGKQEGFFAQTSSSRSSGGARTPREMMMEREYQLVGRAERNIFGQAVVAAVALVFYIYVGLSGGIVSGTDAQIKDFGGDDEIPFERLMPVQRDREASVWL